MNLVVFKTNALGDNVVFLPVVQELRRQFPTAQLSLVANPQLGELYTADVPVKNTLYLLPDDLRTAWRHPWRVRAGCVGCAQGNRTPCSSPTIRAPWRINWRDFPGPAFDSARSLACPGAARG